MKFFIYTEFIEGPQDVRLFGFKIGQTQPTIDLISIGIVAEDGREFYAISKDFNLREAWNRHHLDHGSGDARNQPPRKVYWIRENVLKPIYEDLYEREWDWEPYDFCYSELKRLIGIYGQTNKDIAQGVFQFCTNDSLTIEKAKHYNVSPEGIEFYGYYSDYDHVALCWLFGKMVDLPKGFPQYTRDLKQTLDDKVSYLMSTGYNKDWVKFKDGQKNEKYDASFDDCLNRLKLTSTYPRPCNEHSAIHDAKWNKELYDFLKTL